MITFKPAAEQEDKRERFALSPPVPAANRSLEAHAPTRAENNGTIPGRSAMLTRAFLIGVALFAFTLGAIGSARAQTATPAAVPVPSCDSPGDPPRVLTTESGRAATEHKLNEWSNKMKTYVDCLKHFIDDEQAAAAPHIKAVNAARDELGKAVKTYNDAQAARPQQ